jgi:hypothetical protein
MLQWFLANGNSVLNSIAALLMGGQVSGILSANDLTKYGVIIAAGLAILHSVFAPKPVAAAVVADPTPTQAAAAATVGAKAP